MAARTDSASRTSRYNRLAIAQFFDAFAWLLAIPGWLVLRYEGTAGFSPSGAWLRVLLAVAVAVVASSSVAVVLVLRNGRPIVGSFEDMWRLATCNAVGGVVLLIINGFAWPHLIPNSVVVGATATATLASLGWRGILRLRRERLRGNRSSAARTLVFGAGDGGIQIITSLLRDPSSSFYPVAVLDDDPNKQVLAIRGVRVLGDREAIGSVAQRFDAKVLIIAVPSANSVLVRDIAALAVDAGLEVRVLPSITELFDQTVGNTDIREVTELDLLGRDAVKIDLAAAAALLSGKRVMVTGAGGSIGSEISRQVYRLGPAELILLDRDESALHSLQLELEGRALLDSRHLVVADIRDRERILQVFEEHRPDVVFHAAALKHLSLLEMHPSEALKTNVYGTRNVLDAAGANSATHVVNISTDKAANPTSALGASKRLAEGLTSAAAGRFDGTYLSVRFGNVLGSRGTVLDSLRAQIAAGGPMTITDPEVTRYFMTVTEAVQLVLQSATAGGSGEVMVLDMGEPVRIADVAMQLAAQAPRPIEIVYTGLRPGEKLHEELFGEGEFGRRAVHPMITHVSVPALHNERLEVFAQVDDASATGVMLTVVRTVMAGTSAGTESAS